VECHSKQQQAWAGSQHQLAMQPATEKSVLGNFANARFSSAGITSTFYKRDGKFFVRTDGRDGKPAEFEIKYTFGVAPLQQYLIAFPDGRLQALSIVWDTRPKDQGGQRWYHLYPKEKIKAGDPLHWTGLQQNWNFMCSECHSTNVLRNYDEKTDTFKTSWSEINVACEACHGPGSAHVQWAHQRERTGANGLVVHFDERAGARWVIDATTGNATRSAARTSSKEIETCAYCHARRAQVWEPHTPGKPLADTHVPALLSAGLYEADGQMRDEVYNYGSFLQSKMQARGVTCSDCHEPHSGTLRAPGSGVCSQCHAQTKYATPEHSHHTASGAQIGCPECHMPVRTYMGIDRRHDHSFRVPRPDLSVTLSTPNACNDCHKDKSAKWAAAAVESWYGPQRKGFQTFGAALHAAREGQRQARKLLLQRIEDSAQPAIARATAFQELAPYLTDTSVSDLQRGVLDADPLVRLGALRAFATLPADRLWGPLHQLLSDPVRALRIEAAGYLAGAAPSELPAEERAALDSAVQEYIAAQRINADRPEAHLNLGLLYAQRHDAVAAEAQYRRALVLDPGFVPAAINLADLYRALERDADAERVLRDILARAPRDASAHHALGLLRVRAKRQAAALEELALAARIDPGTARYGYTYGIALNSFGQRKAALSVLENNHRRHPSDAETLAALVTINRDVGDKQAALRWLEALQELNPGDPRLQTLERELSQQ
jgi:tetratricopeptide (TPR) repeat protein